MVNFVEQQRAGIAELCRRHGVRTLELFGSAAAGQFNVERSDLDFMVEFTEQQPQGAADRYFGLLEGLESIFGRHVDLVMRKAVRNPYFLSDVDRHSQKLYAA